MCAQTVPTSYREALFVQVVVPEEMPMAPPSQGGSAGSNHVGVARWDGLPGRRLPRRAAGQVSDQLRDNTRVSWWTSTGKGPAHPTSPDTRPVYLR